MPNVLYYANAPALTDFLARLHSELKVDKDGASNIGEAVRVLKNYGYYASESESLYDIPSYTQGEDKQDGGHAWIIDGRRKITDCTEYIMYLPSMTRLPEYKYFDYEADRIMGTQSSETMYHMNWGWGGKNDGWFKASDISVPGNDKNGNPTILDFAKSRKYIKITGHK